MLNGRLLYQVLNTPPKYTVLFLLSPWFRAGPLQFWETQALL